MRWVQTSLWPICEFSLRELMESGAWEALASAEKALSRKIRGVHSCAMVREQLLNDLVASALEGFLVGCDVPDERILKPEAYPEDIPDWEKGASLMIAHQGRRAPLMVHRRKERLIRDPAALVNGNMRFTWSRSTPEMKPIFVQVAIICDDPSFFSRKDQNERDRRLFAERYAERLLGLNAKACITGCLPWRMQEILSRNYGQPIIDGEKEVVVSLESTSAPRGLPEACMAVGARIPAKKKALKDDENRIFGKIRIKL